MQQYNQLVLILPSSSNRLMEIKGVAWKLHKLNNRRRYRHTINLYVANERTVAT